jgi:hypothetical protein
VFDPRPAGALFPASNEHIQLARPPRRHPCCIRRAARAKGDADMPSQAMQGAIDALRDRRNASARQAPPTLAERRGSPVAVRDRLG